jgi:hypothetical protein
MNSNSFTLRLPEKVTSAIRAHLDTLSGETMSLYVRKVIIADLRAKGIDLEENLEVKK